MKGGSNLRTLVSELQEYFQQKVPELVQTREFEIKTLESQPPTLDTKSVNYWHERAAVGERLHLLKRQLQHLKARTEERFFYQRLAEIKTPNRFLQEFFQSLAQPELISPDHCGSCGSACTLKKNLARLVCVACGQTRRIITNLTSLQAKTSYASKPEKTTKKTNANNNGNTNANNSQNSLQRNEHVRIKWLHKQLQQYRIGSRKIPKDDIFAVARRLRSIHLKSVSVVKHTITRSILKALNKTDCVSQASKIADICNGTPVAAFNDVQYLNVMKRLLAVQKVYIEFKSGKEPQEKLTRVNFPPFQFLLKQFCILEGWHDLQECFTHSKTLEVYQTQISEWRVFLPRLKIADPNHNWDYPDQRSSLDALRLL